MALSFPFNVGNSLRVRRFTGYDGTSDTDPRRADR